LGVGQSQIRRDLSPKGSLSEQKRLTKAERRAAREQELSSKQADLGLKSAKGGGKSATKAERRAARELGRSLGGRAGSRPPPLPHYPEVTTPILGLRATGSSAAGVVCATIAAATMAGDALATIAAIMSFVTTWIMQTTVSFSRSVRSSISNNFMTCCMILIDMVVPP
jgi:hypothetical protein